MDRITYRDDAAREAFEVVGAALQRGVKVGTLRALVASCPNGHKLIEVYRVGDGRHVALCRRHWHEYRDQVVVMVDDSAESTAVVACRCLEPLVVHRLGELLPLVDAGRRRVVLQSGAPARYANHN